MVMASSSDWSDLLVLADRPLVPALGLASAILVVLCLALLLIRCP
jgi:hypothetical protein